MFSLTDMSNNDNCNNNFSFDFLAKFVQHKRVKKKWCKQIKQLIKIILVSVSINYKYNMALQLAQLYLTSDAETTWKQQSTISYKNKMRHTIVPKMTHCRDTTYKKYASNPTNSNCYYEYFVLKYSHTPYDDIFWLFDGPKHYYTQMMTHYWFPETGVYVEKHIAVILCCKASQIKLSNLKQPETCSSASNTFSLKVSRHKNDVREFKWFC